MTNIAVIDNNTDTAFKLAYELAASGHQVDIISPSTAPRGILSKPATPTDPAIRYFGNLKVGTEISISDLTDHYQVVYTSPTAAYSGTAASSDFSAYLSERALPATSWKGPLPQLDYSVAIASAHGIPWVP